MTTPLLTTPATVALTPQQQAAIEFVRRGRGSLLLEAVAGSGKTFTLIQMVKELPPRASVAFCAFNKSIATEIEGKVKAVLPDAKNIRCGTLHSFGFSAWRRVANPKLVVEGKKCAHIAEEQKVPEHLIQFALALVSLAKQAVIGVTTNVADTKAWLDIVYHHDLEDLLAEDGVELSEEMVDDLVMTGIKAAQAILARSIETARDVVDFDDMIYMPLKGDVRMWQQDVILLDECQDTNPARRMLVKKMLRPGGRLIAVGDRHQAIYGFTGADNDSMALIQREFSCTELPLSVTFRCPKAVVREAQRYVSHIQSAPTASEGAVETMTQEAFLTLPSFNATDVILCRNTKPLVETAFNLIRRGIPCRVEGRDIGRGLMALAKKWKVKKLTTLVDRLDKYQTRETQRLLAKGQEQKADALNDKIDTLRIVMAGLLPDGTVDDLQAQIDKLFSDSETERRQVLTLSTVHKSKGREWPRVYLLGANRYMPSPFARQQWQQEQEINLLYVAITRAQQQLVHVFVPLPKR